MQDIVATAVARRLETYRQKARFVIDKPINCVKTIPTLDLLNAVTIIKEFYQGKYSLSRLQTLRDIFE